MLRAARAAPDRVAAHLERWAKMKMLRTILIFLAAIATAPLFAASDDARIRIKIRDAELHSALVTLLDSVQAGDGVKVWSLGHASWKEYLRGIGYENNLNDFRHDGSKSLRISVDYGEIYKSNDEEIAFFSLTVTAASELVDTYEYKCFIVFQRNLDGWAFLNLPFKDFTIPSPAAILTGRAPSSTSRARQGRGSGSS